MFEDLNLKIKYLTEIVEDLRYQINFKMKDDTLVKKHKPMMLKVKCSQCSEYFDSKIELKSHAKNNLINKSMLAINVNIKQQS